MGGFKDQLPDDHLPSRSRCGGFHTRTDGRDWDNASPRRPCPICGGASWCQTHRDGSVVLCKRVASDREKVNRADVTYYVHRLSDAPRVAVEALPPTTARAGVDELDAAYNALLAALRLDAADREGLRARGLDDAAIDAGGYRSLGLEGRARLARVVIDAVGEDVARGVPGIVWRTADDGHGWWSMGGSPGLLVPCRDDGGRVFALKVRRRDVEAGHQRYLYVTSARAGGASALAALHVPAVAARLDAPILVITEGELKADVATHLLGAPVVGLPGVGSWRLAVEHALAIGVRRVAVAFDMDQIRNAHVARAARDCVHALGAAGFEAEVWRWDPKFKGVDDMLLAQRAEGEVRHAG